jgi:uncharacterized protein (DUF4415 family)
MASILWTRLVSLRLDADVLEWLKAQGYQTRSNAILRAFKEASA